MRLRFTTLRIGATLAVALVGFGALRVGGRLDGLLAGLALGSWALAFWAGRPRLSSKTWLGLQVSFLVWLALAGVVLGVHVLDLFAQLLVFVQVHRLLTRSAASDDRYVHFIAFGQVLLASVLTVDIAWFGLFCVFSVTLTWALLLSRLAMSVERDWLQRYGQGPESEVRPRAFDGLDDLIGPRFVGAVTALTAVLLVGTVALFFVLPRMQVGLFSGGLLQSVHVSGFSERVRLGEVGTMQLSNEPVMRVRVHDRSGQPYAGVANLYWHGLALDRFDGLGWELSDQRRTMLSLPTHQPVKGPPDGPWMLEQQISVEVLDQRVLFHVQRPTGIYGDFRNLEAVQTDGFYVPGARSRLDYTVYSQLPVFDPAALRLLDPRAAPPDIHTLYTQLPANISPRISTLAGEWSRGAGSPLDALLLLQDRLRGDEFTYSLDQPASAYPDPLLAFVDTVKEGHCEYFASALTVMARTQGLPARVVNGFSGADYNPVGEYWVVRASHAHSWVEVWFPERGWTVFDPTPSSGGAIGSAQLTLAARLSAWSDYARVSWSAVLLDYEAGTQLDAIRGLARWMREGGSFELPSLREGVLGKPPGDTEPPPRDLRTLAAVAGGFAVLFALAAVVRRFQTRLRVATATRSVQRLVRRWQRSADRAGVEHPGVGGSTAAWARWAEGHDPARWAGSVDAIQDYEAARFGEAASAGIREIDRLRRA